jgi:hypothetical protein
MEENSMERWTAADVKKTTWFNPVMDQIRVGIGSVAAEHDRTKPQLEAEHAHLQQQLQGWSLSLAKTDLSVALRALITKDAEAAVQRQQEIETELGQLDALRRFTEGEKQVEKAAEQLSRLADALDAQNQSWTNLELSLHIDAIRCYQDGRVMVRTCKLGALPDYVHFFDRPDDVTSEPDMPDSAAIPARPRRRARRRVVVEHDDPAELRAAAHVAADVDRFAGLGPEWFWEDTLQPVKKLSWAEEYAARVLARQKETGWSLAKLAKEFGKSRPTIKSAIDHAETQAATSAAGASANQADPA